MVEVSSKPAIEEYLEQIRSLQRMYAEGTDLYNALTEMHPTLAEALVVILTAAATANRAFSAEGLEISTVEYTRICLDRSRDNDCDGQVIGSVLLHLLESLGKDEESV